MSCIPNLPAPKTRPSKRAGDEGALHTWFAQIIAGEDADRVIEAAAQDARTADADFPVYPRKTIHADAAIASALAWAKSPSGPKGGENSKYHKILNCRFARLYFLTLYRLPLHFCGSKDVMMKTFLARQGRDMGVRH